MKRLRRFDLPSADLHQVHGAAMGSPVSPIVANLYMEHLRTLPYLQLIDRHHCGSAMYMTRLS